MRSIAQRGAMVFGVVFLLVGIAGLFVRNGTTMEADMEAAAMLFGLFPVNLLHNVVHLAFGAWGLLASRSHDASRTYGKVGAVIYLVLVALAFVDPTGFGVVPIGGHDIWLHLVLALGLGYIGFAGGEPRRSMTV